jgi:non-canonical poly(A) RNA polymerase PAPD5/7
MAEYDIYKHSTTLTQQNASPYQKLATELRSKWKDELTYLEVLENTKIPLVKFTHGPTNLNVDICFNQYNGVLAAELMTKFMDVMPPLKPLTFVLKYFMAARGLNEPYSGGIGSFMLQMMIVSFLQHRERFDYNTYKQERRERKRSSRNYHDRHNQRGRSRNRRDESSDDDYDDDDYDGYQPYHMNLGSLLIEFFELYGMDFNYLTTAISVRNDGFYFPKGHYSRREFFFTNPSRAFTLGLENPIDITMDVGKSSFRMALIQKSYEVALRVLLSHVAQPVVHTDSILASIIPPNEEMYKRATLYKVLMIEAQLSSQGYHANDNDASSNDDNDKGHKKLNKRGRDKKRSKDSSRRRDKKKHKKRRRSSPDSSMEVSDSD